MRALTLVKTKSDLELQERPALEPDADDVVVQLKAAALNRRDFWITQGMYPGIEPPVVLGSDGAGCVAKVGSNIDRVWVDREVIINPGLSWGDDQSVQSKTFNILGLPRDGTFATEVAVPASQLHAKPVHLNWNEAAALPLAGVTAWRAVFAQGGLKEGETVLITGIGGGVATFALQFAVAAGAEVWVTSSSSSKISRAVDLGARGGYDYTTEDWSTRMRKDSIAPNLIIDSAGGENYRSLINVAAPGSRIVNYGATVGAPEKLELAKVFWKQLRLQGTTMGSPSDFTAMLEFIDERRLVPIVESVVPLIEGNAAVQQMKSSPQFGKFVLSCEG